ncbi:phage/plasmid primase, P4 family [Bradyrhizobium sp. SZCCHNR1015]|uniref:phage/plasmid primase, P4 family n=1 Tax=Bradyrhizobium sp. SZCCHNR1015 TaxID=3057338 RepID=UPI002915DD6A|nr:phage/plasmid primase, P4 family [Bradyrhizobium sp. SZCCHNR1015]
MSAITNIDVARQARRMMEIFPASSRGHASWDPKGPMFRKESGKLKPNYAWVETPITVENWRQHLAGERALVVPFACDDGTTKVSLLDIDDYSGIDFIRLLESIRNLGLPLYVRKSKSGGAHVIAFHDEPITVPESAQVCTAIARVLGFELRDVEIFPPVQKDPASEPKQVNVPFLGGDDSSCLLVPGSKVAGAMTLDQFLKSVKHLTAAQRDELIGKAGQEQKSASLEDCQRFASDHLQRYVEELPSMRPGGRSNALYRCAAKMGNMINSGWIARDEVYGALLGAVEQWGERERFEDTLRRALKKGEARPHHPMNSSDPITEDGAALDFAELHEEDLRFDHDAGGWFEWSGSHWRRDRTQFAFAEARDLVRDLSRGQPQKVINITSKANFAGNVERLARADRRLAVTQEAWDRDTFLLGTPGGTVDLRTGELREARPEDNITKLAAVAPSRTADCPGWLRFLSEATGADEELQRFLQVLCGYSMTGETREHLLVFIHGPGGNGKSVYLSTIGGLLGDYAVEAAMDTFTESKFDRHPTDLAMLRGARLVTSAETSEGRAWAETRIKQMTGGDKITARFMRRDFFTYVPQFQLQIVGNHKPQLSSVTEAMRRRLVMVPFHNKPKRKDTRLSEKLRQEYQGIMRWMIDGCLAWQKDGIRLPAVVKADTNDYFADQDQFGHWIEECLERTLLSVSENSQRLFHAWAKFAEESGASRLGDIAWFNKEMKARGFAGRKSNGKLVYDGVRLMEPRI